MLSSVTTNIEMHEHPIWVHQDDLMANAKHEVYQLPPDTHAESNQWPVEGSYDELRNMPNMKIVKLSFFCQNQKDTADWKSGTVRKWVWWWCHIKLAFNYPKHVLVKVDGPHALLAATVHLHCIVCRKSYFSTCHNFLHVYLCHSTVYIKTFVGFERKTPFCTSARSFTTNLKQYANILTTKAFNFAQLCLLTSIIQICWI